VLFDGANFYNYAKRISPKTHLTSFNYSEFSKFITKNKNIDICYYVGEIKQYRGNKKSQMLYSAQQSLFSNLRSQKINIKLGYLLRGNGKYHEKGTDVQIAVDMVVGAIKNTYDNFYLFSSDTDLIPAIKIVLEEGKNVYYMSFENFVSKAMSSCCNKKIIICPKDITSFA